MPKKLRPNDRGFPWPKNAPVYHATAALRAVLREGLKARVEIGRHVTGGGSDYAISFTLDLRVARAIVVGIRALRDIARGKLPLGVMIIQGATIAPKGLHQALKNVGLTNPDDVVMYDRGFREFSWSQTGGFWTSFELRGKNTEAQLETLLASGLTERVKEHLHKGATKPHAVTGWAPFELLVEVLGNESGRQRYGKHIEFYKAFLAFGEGDKELYDPFFFLTDVNALAEISENDIGIVEAHLDADWVCAHLRDAERMGVLEHGKLGYTGDWPGACESRLDDVARGGDARHVDIRPPVREWEQPEPRDTVAYLGGAMSELRAYSSQVIHDVALIEKMRTSLYETLKEWDKKLSLTEEQYEVFDEPVAYPYFRAETPWLSRP